MRSDGRAYLRTVLSVWVALCAIAFYFSAQAQIPRFIALSFVAAALAESALYLSIGFAATREMFDAISPPAMRALMLTASAVAPYLIYSIASGTFHWRWLGVLALLATVASAWFIAQTRHTPAVDILFLAFMAAVTLTRVFSRVYVTLHPRAPADFLGHLMWIRVGVFSVLSFRRLGGIGFGFLPSRRDWGVGVQQFAAFVPVGVLLGLWLKFARPHMPAGPWWKAAAVAAGTFCGILWVVALSEEFFFRGVLQQALAKMTNSRWMGLALASIAFGLVHLPFRRFPNWQLAILAGASGVFYGIAYVRAKSIRAAMVTHALAVTAWRVFFG